MRNAKNIRTVLLETVKHQTGLSLAILVTVVGAVVSALLPPLLLAKIVDDLTSGVAASLGNVLLYFGLLALTGSSPAA